MFSLCTHARTSWRVTFAAGSSVSSCSLSESLSTIAAVADDCGSEVNEILADVATSASTSKKSSAVMFHSVKRRDESGSTKGGSCSTSQFWLDVVPDCGGSLNPAFLKQLLMVFGVTRSHASFSSVSASRMFPPVKSEF